MSSLAPDDVWKLKVLTARLLAGRPELYAGLARDKVMLAEQIAVREIQDPEAIDILVERDPIVSDLAPILRKWADRYGVLVASREEALFTVATDYAKHLLKGTMDPIEAAGGIAKLTLGEEHPPFKPGDFDRLIVLRCFGESNRTDEELTEDFRKLSANLLLCYERGDLQAWNGGLNTLSLSKRAC